MRYVFGIFVFLISIGAFAAEVPLAPPPQIEFRGPNNLPFDVTRGRYVAFSTGPGGAANLGSAYAAKVGRASVPIVGTRVISAAALARVALPLARLTGPIGIGLTLAQLIWDEVGQQWMAPASGGALPSPTGNLNICSSISSPLNQVYTVGQSACRRVPSSSHGCTGVPADASSWGIMNYIGDSSLPCGWSMAQTINLYVPPVVPPVPATDQQIEDGIYTELVSRGMGSDLSRRLVASGYEPAVLAEAGPQSLSGPSSVSGGSISAVSTGPAGTTTTITNTNYDITYAGNVVSVVTNTSTTITAPDGVVTTATETASGGDPAPADQPIEDFCVSHPESVACQSLDVPPEERPDPEERTFSILPTGGFGGAGSCPSDVVVDFLGQPLSWSYRPACDFFSGVRPAVIAMAWIAAVLIALGGYRRDD